MGSDRALASVDGTVKIAPGGFYIGRRGNLVQVPRAGGSYDYTGLARQVSALAPPLVLTMAGSSNAAVVVRTLATLAATGNVPVFLPAE